MTTKPMLASALSRTLQHSFVWLGLAMLLSVNLLTSARARDAAISKHEGSKYNVDAIAVETAIRKDVDAPLSVAFHHDQAFRGKILGKPWRVLSVAWHLENGGEEHCVLAVLSGDEEVHVDALAGELDAPPWSCDGEPTLRITDLDGDTCPEVIALYPMRPPSGEQFRWPIVLRCDAAKLKWDMDAERTRRLQKTLMTAPLDSVKQAEDILRKSP